MCMRSIRSLAHAHPCEQFLSDHHWSSTTIQAFSTSKFNIQLKQNGKIPATQHGIRFVWCEFHNLKCCFVFTFGIALCFHWTFVKMVFLCAKMMLCVIVLLKFHQRGKFLLHTLNNCGSANVLYVFMVAWLNWNRYCVW